MAPGSQRRISLALVLTITTVAVCATRNFYEVDSSLNRRSDDYVVEFVPLAESHNVVRRQTSSAAAGGGSSSSSSNNNLSSGKMKSDDVKVSQKLDKNSASIPSDTPMPSVKKNLVPPMDETKGEYDDQIIDELSNGNASQVKTVLHDHHLYYNSTLIAEPERIDEFWIDVEKMQNVKTHDMLSKSYRRAATVAISFDFPFYGHMLRNATIATGGFLYLGDYMHSWLASTQYIAPLMANFDTTIKDTSIIRYADNGTDFIVQWEDTFLQDHKTAGPFTFQVRLRYTGDIIFAYKKIPVDIKSISDSEHPVRVGVSDAYIIDRVLFFQRRKIIYEYHRVEIKKELISNLTAVVLTALPSCITIKDCDSCIQAHINFECTWCPQAQRCSDGMDRYRHDWILRGCDSTAQGTADPSCPLPTTLASVDVSDGSNDDMGGYGYSSFATEPPVSPSPSNILSPEITNFTNNGTNRTSLTNATTITSATIATNSIASTEPYPYSVSSSKPDPLPSSKPDPIPSSNPDPIPTSKPNQIPSSKPDPLSSSKPDPTIGDLSTSSESSSAYPPTDYNYDAMVGSQVGEGKTSISAAGVIGILFIVALTIGVISWIVYAYRYPHTSSGQLIIKYRPSQWHWLKGEADYTPASVHI